MDNKRIDMYERRFKDHVATVKQLDEETQVLTFKRPDSIMWSTEFIFRKNFIFVSGDTGCAVFSTTWEPTWDYDWQNISEEYFAEKCKAFFGEKYVLDKDKAKKDIKELIINDMFYCDKDEAETLANEVIELVDTDSCWDDELFTEKDNEGQILKQSYLILRAVYSSQTLNEYNGIIVNDEEYQECLNYYYDYELYNIGKELHPQFELWLYVLRKAKEQLQNKNAL